VGSERDLTISTDVAMLMTRQVNIMVYAIVDVRDQKRWRCNCRRDRDVYNAVDTLKSNFECRR
jgi:hypothetical protein